MDLMRIMAPFDCSQMSCRNVENRVHAADLHGEKTNRACGEPWLANIIVNGPQAGSRLRLPQSATVSSQAFPNASIHAQVVSISPAVNPRSTTTATQDARDKDTVAVFLNVERGGPALPIGSAVTVRFDVCPSKT